MNKFLFFLNHFKILRFRFSILNYIGLFLLLSLKLYSQNEVDTLETKYILIEKNLLKRAESYQYYALLFLYTDIKKAIVYNSKAENLFNKINNFEGITNCIQTKANIAFVQNEPIKSYEIFQQAILYCDKHKNEKWAQKSKYMIYGDLSNVTNLFGDYQTSLKYLVDSYEYFKNRNHEVAHNGCLMISELNMMINEFDESLKYSQKAIEHGKIYLIDKPNDPYQGLVLANYFKIKSLVLLKRIGEAEIELRHLKKTIDNLGHQPYYIKFYILESMIANYEKKYDEAIENIDKIIKLCEKTGNQVESTTAKFEKGEILMKLKKYSQAKQVFLELLKNQKGISLVNIYHNLSIIENILKKHKEAYLFLEKSKNIKDSIDVVEKTNKAIFWNIKYESEKKQKQIIDLENEKYQKNISLQKQNTLIYSLIAGLLVVGLIGFIGYRNINYRRKLAENEIVTLQKEKQLTATESILKGQEAERSRLAKDLHDGLGGILSSLKYSLTSMTGNYVLTEQGGQIFGKALETLETAIGEMRRVAHSMMPETLLKFGLKDAIQSFCEGINQSGKLQINFQAYGLENRLEQSVEVTIYRIIQELLNNVMKHAQANKALVQITKTDDLLILTVEDDGKGFDKSILENKNGIGISNVDSRVAYLGGTVEINSNNGTSIVIEIPLKEDKRNG